MKFFRFAAAAAAFAVLAAGCTTSSPAQDAGAPPARNDSDSYILHTPYGANAGGSTSKPPRLTVGVSDPNTELILPWFLNDIINFVNYR
jgi:hypothetical protein